jgi:hypothetical protein
VPDLEPRDNAPVITGLTSGTANEIAKAVAQQLGFDPVSASAIGGAVGGVIQTSPDLLSLDPPSGF